MGTGVKASGLALLVVVSMLVGGLVTAQVVDHGTTTPAATASPTSTVVVATPEATSQSVVRTPSDGTGAGGAGTLSAFPDLPSLVAGVENSVVAIELDGGSEAGGGDGSGFVLDTDGHILTNYHVVEGAQVIVARFLDGNAAQATVVGADPSNDIAVIQVAVDPQLLHPVTLGDSDAVRVGDPVFAIGSPFAEDFTVTSGIVSAVGRVTESSFTGRKILNVIQTDAALNPGNSGGPLFNANGEVVGVNSSITGPNGFRGNVGLGFSVPSNTVLRFLPQLLVGDQVIHTQLGVGGHDVDPVIAAQLGLGTDSGFLVTTVGGGAAAAGVQLDDIITSIAGKPIRTFEDLAIQIDAFNPGDQVALTIVRGNETIQLTATLQPWQ